MCSVKAWPTAARQGCSCRRQHRGLRLPLLLSTEGSHGQVSLDWAVSVLAESGVARNGEERRVEPIVADGSTEGPGSPCCSL